MAEVTVSFFYCLFKESGGTVGDERSACQGTDTIIPYPSTLVGYILNYGSSILDFLNPMFNQSTERLKCRSLVFENYS